MRRYALIGHPLGHSMSPPIHARLFALEGIDAAYDLCAFPPAAFDEQLSSLRTRDGFNITIPYKERILPHLDALHDSAARYASVNTVACKNGLMTGYNTDCVGFLRALSAKDTPLSGRVCLLGAGGAGRMFAIESLMHHANLTIAVRSASLARGQALADELQTRFGQPVTVCPLETLTGSFDLLLNATPVGMFPQTDACSVENTLLEQTKTVFDCIYNPSETLLVRRAKECGCKAFGGMAMLVWQAAAAHEFWHGSHFTAAQIAPIIHEMEETLRQRERLT